MREERTFCCTGCAGVFELLHKNDLGDFYALGIRSGVRGQATPDPAIEALDRVKPKIARLDGWVKLMRQFFRRRDYSAIFIIGVLNGLLPCGAVYLALAGAVATGAVLNGSVFMILFGLGTLPVMAALPFLGNWLGRSHSQKLRKHSGYLAAGLGVWLILRGSDLGIPYLSPEWTEGGLSCCDSPQ